MFTIIKRVMRIAGRECIRLKRNPAYLLCMVVFPAITALYFTSLMGEGVPENMPVGIVDLDNTATTRKLSRTIDAMQSTKVVARYNDFAAARQSAQRGEIYGFVCFHKGFTDELLSSRRPQLPFYYSNSSLTAGSLVFRDLKTSATLASASVGASVLTAKGLTEKQVETFLQPIKVDLHPLGNPWASYNIYLSVMLVPGALMLFVFLTTAYSIGSELKNRTSRQWLAAARGNMLVALLGKLLPQTVVYLMMFFGFMAYIFYGLGFPHNGSILSTVAIGLLTITAGQGLGAFLFGVYPSMRMSMSVCSLLAVLSFSLVGTAFPTFSMSPALEGIACLFPLRHYFMAYQICILNGFPLSYVWPDMVALLALSLSPMLLLYRIRKAIAEYVYLP